MSGLKAIRKRIASVKNTQKITRAMKMVAAARLRRAQQQIVQLRPYANKAHEVLSSIAAELEPDELPLLLRPRERKHALLVVISSDRGLAGAFNANVNKTAFRRWKALEAEGIQVSFAVVGRKAREYFARRGAVIAHYFTGIFERMSIERGAEIGRVLVSDFAEQKVDAVEVVFNEFRSAISQRVRNDVVLPIQFEAKSDQSGTRGVIYEPNRTELLERLVPLHVDVQLYRALLDSIASEHGARMTAMDSATKNASEMLARLTLQYNRARQAAITKELMEIIGGAEALGA